MTEGAADPGVGQAAGDRAQHLGLPDGEPVKHDGGWRGVAALTGEAGDQPPGDRRGEQRVAGGDDPDCAHELGEWKVEDRS